MRNHPIQNVDILEKFVIHESLSFSEMIIYNYALKYSSKEDIIGHARVFLTQGPVRSAYNRLTKSFKILSEYMLDGKIMVKVETFFEKDIEKVEVKDRIGRPTLKSLQE